MNSESSMSLPKNSKPTLKLAMEDVVAQKLAQDRPTIDAAVKSFMSLVAARSLTAAYSNRWKGTSQDALACARTMLHAINTFKFTSLDTTTTGTILAKGVEQTTVALVWNGLVDSDQKPSRFLGRLALIQCWNDILVHTIHPAETYEQSVLFCEEFGTLLGAFIPDKVPTEDSDAHFLWDPETGAELERRRANRMERAEATKEHTNRMEVAQMDDTLPSDDIKQAATADTE